MAAPSLAGRLQGCQLSASLSTGTQAGTAPVPLAPCRRQNPSSLTAGRLRAPGLMVTMTVPLRATGASESGLESLSQASARREFKFKLGRRAPAPWPAGASGNFTGKSPALSRLRTLQARRHVPWCLERAGTQGLRLAAPAYEGRFILVYPERPLALPVAA
jgi:hypothetical protein